MAILRKKSSVERKIKGVVHITAFGQRTYVINAKMQH